MLSPHLFRTHCLSVNIVDIGITRITHQLRKAQSADGAWRYCAESGPLTDAYMIILLRTLGIHDEAFIRGLADRIAARQESSGAWKLFHDEVEGNLSATIEAYYALLSSGNSRSTDAHMIGFLKIISQPMSN